MAVARGCDIPFCLLCFVCLFWEPPRMTSPHLGCPCSAQLHPMMSTYIIHPTRRLCLIRILKKSKKHLVVSHLWILASYQMNLPKKIKTRLSLEARVRMKKIVKLKVLKVNCRYPANGTSVWAQTAAVRRIRTHICTLVMLTLFSTLLRNQTPCLWRP